VIFLGLLSYGEKKKIALSRILSSTVVDYVTVNSEIGNTNYSFTVISSFTFLEILRIPPRKMPISPAMVSSAPMHTLPGWQCVCVAEGALPKWPEIIGADIFWQSQE
jgi:hypothetical protein